KLGAKRHNERTKLLSNAFHAMSLGVIGAGVIIPSVASPRRLLDVDTLAWVLIAVVLHLVAQAVLQVLRSED
ncbi:MAG: hypothetical protein ACJ8CO_00330, partial [Microvirga sp.]